ncbi:MAG TPA: hypothetical protein VKA49_03155, partial [Flavitalea sp.]|nr:hypothetical protein [Flavitalea sp.]
MFDCKAGDDVTIPALPDPDDGCDVTGLGIFDLTTGAFVTGLEVTGVPELKTGCPVAGLTVSVFVVGDDDVCGVTAVTIGRGDTGLVVFCVSVFNVG